MVSITDGLVGDRLANSVVPTWNYSLYRCNRVMTERKAVKDTANFVMRIPIPMHKKLKREAKKRNMSMNKLIVDIFADHQQGAKEDPVAIIKRAAKRL